MISNIWENQKNYVKIIGKYCFLCDFLNMDVEKSTSLMVQCIDWKYFVIKTNYWPVYEIVI